MAETPTSSIRLAELVAALALGIDLGFGQPMEHVLRQCLIALRIAERIGLDPNSRAQVYYTALLVNVGCHSDAHEQAKWFGDDIALKAGKYVHTGWRAALAGLRMIGGGSPPLHRFRLGLEFVVSGHREVDGMIARHAEVAESLARQLGLGEAVCAALRSSYEQWDGRGWPGRISGAEVPIASRIAQLAEFAEVAHRVGGLAKVVALMRERGGAQFDPALAGLIAAQAESIFDGMSELRAWDTVIAAEPALQVVLTEQQFDAALLAIANFVDLKSPYTLGHSAAVAELCASAGQMLGLSASAVVTLRRAGLVHDFGRLGVSNAIHDKPAPLAAAEWERVRMQVYFTERMLHQSPVLAPLGALVIQHRERLDGSGYPGALSGSAITLPGRILGAADAYQALREPRPHRAAHSDADAGKLLRAEVRAGRFDGDAVEAVLGAAGHRIRKRRDRPAGLTAREIDVLRLLARGLSAKQIGERLGMAGKTASNHIEHIYAKIGASNRVAASLFAMQHGLLSEDDATGESLDS